MIDDKALRKAIYDWAVAYTPVAEEDELSVIWSNQGVKRPPVPYVSLNIIAGPVKSGGQDDLETLDSGDTRVSGFREITLSINYFGPNAIGYLSALQTSVEFPDVTTYFKSKDIAYISDTGVRDLNGLLENRFENRAQMDMRFRVLSEALASVVIGEEEEIITAIEHVVIENELDDTETEINP
jgi:hypothetical protein